MGGLRKHWGFNSRSSQTTLWRLTSDESVLISFSLCCGGMLPDGSVVKNLPAMQEMQETQVRSLGQEDPQVKEMATQPTILA